MYKYHHYNSNNIDSCKECKRIYILYGDTDAQIEDYHEIVPLDIDTNSTDYNNTETTELYSPYKEILRDNISTPVITPIRPPRPHSNNESLHFFEYKNIGKCKECKRLDKLFGLLDAQPDYNPHKFKPISHKRKTSKKNNSKSKKNKTGGRKTQKRNISRNKKTTKN